MKKIYFVRHGQSQGNVSPLRQSKESPLTLLGKKQAAIIAQRLEEVTIDAFIASSLTRAQETAQIIAQKINKNFESSDLFIERRRPKEQIGKDKDDEIAQESMRLIKENFANPDYHYSDEENFFDLKKRAEEALEFLAKRSEENILVVTHGLFLHVIMASAIFGKELTANEGKHFLRAFHTENTGVTILVYDETLPEPWWLWVWNDHAHLSELAD